MKKSLIIVLAIVAGAVFNTAEAAGKKKKDKKNDKAKVEAVELKICRYGPYRGTC